MEEEDFLYVYKVVYPDCSIFPHFNSMPKSPRLYYVLITSSLININFRINFTKLAQCSR